MLELIASFVINQNQPTPPPINCGQGLEWNAGKKICEPKKQQPKPQQPETKKPETNPPVPATPQDFCERYPQDYFCQRGKGN